MPAPAAAPAAPAAERRSGGCGGSAAGAAPGAVGAAVPQSAATLPPPLWRLMAARAAHEPRAMIEPQCNVQTAICVQYRVGGPGWIRQKNTDIEEHEIRYRSTKASISYTDIEGAYVNIDNSSISGYNNIEVLNFDIDVSSIQ
jgi:hypothetical protein